MVSKVRLNIAKFLIPEKIIKTNRHNLYKSGLITVGGKLVNAVMNGIVTFTNKFLSQLQGMVARKVANHLILDWKKPVIFEDGKETNASLA